MNEPSPLKPIVRLLVSPDVVDEFRSAVKSGALAGFASVPIVVWSSLPPQSVLVDYGTEVEEVA